MTRPMRALTPLAIFALLAAATSVAAQPQSKPQAQPRQCFRAMDWRGSRAAGPREIYIRVGTKDVFRLGFAQDCAGARFPGEVRISNLVTGGNDICSPVDLDITVAPAGSSMSSPCIVSDIAKLTSAEVAALPKKVVP
jgi:hypothetical protein